jgi:hypothetical protein
MIELKDTIRPGALLLAAAAGAAAGFALGLMAGRYPETARRAALALARGVGRARFRIAETVEELSDLWAEAREVALREIEADAFARDAAAAAMAGAAGGAAVATAPPAPERAAAGAAGTVPRARSRRRAAAPAAEAAPPAPRRAAGKSRGTSSRSRPKPQAQTPEG